MSTRDGDERSALAVTLAHVARTFAGLRGSPSRHGVAAVADIDLTVPAGQFAALIGPSGCGKSTLLRLVAGLDRPTAGQVLLDGAATDAGAAAALSRAGRLAFVFQDPHLMPWRTVLGNVALPLELRGQPRRQRYDAAHAAIVQVGLADAASRYPAQLSGGMRMRVSLARALVTQPQLLLLDEPFAAVDELTRHRLDEQLRDLWQHRGMTVLFVTHSVAEAAFLAQRVVVMSPRPGRVIADETMAEHRAGRADPAFLATVQRLVGLLEPAEATA